MRTFYIFKINNEYSKLTKNIPFNLYSAYLNIRLGTNSNLKYLYNEYSTFTESLGKKTISKYLYGKMNKLEGYTIYNDVHMFSNYYTDEVSKLIVKNSYMILKSNMINSTFFSELYKIPNIFVIDFDNHDYFWLHNLEQIKAC